MTAAWAGLCALTWLGWAPLVRACAPQLAVDLAWLPTPGAEVAEAWARDPIQWGPPGHDPLDPWGRPWSGVEYHFEGHNAGAAGWLRYSCGPDGEDQGGEGDDVTVTATRLILERDQAWVQRAPGGSAALPTPSRGQWVLALADQAAGVLALALAALLAGEPLLRCVGRPRHALHLLWLAPLPVALGVWFVDRALALAGVEWQGPLQVVPGRVSIQGGVAAGLLLGVALWQQHAVPALVEAAP